MIDTSWEQFGSLNVKHEINNDWPSGELRNCFFFLSESWQLKMWELEKFVLLEKAFPSGMMILMTFEIQYLNVSLKISPGEIKPWNLQNKVDWRDMCSVSVLCVESG